MCESKCSHPDLRPKDGKCSKELIERCHGHEENHPCENNEKEKENN